MTCNRLLTALRKPPKTMPTLTLQNRRFVIVGKIALTFSFLKSHSISIQSRPPVTTDHGLLGLNLTHEQIFSCPSNLCKYKNQHQYKGVQICDEFAPNLKLNIRKIMQCYASHLLKVLLKMQIGNGNERKLKKQVWGS